MKPEWRRLIAVMQIVGGVSGLVSIISQLITHRLDPISFNQAWLLIAIFLLALFAGAMLWRDTRVGRVASIICQLIQLPKQLSPESGFMISYGFDFFWMVLSRPDRSEWLFDFRSPSSYLLTNPGIWQKGIGVSFVSLLALRLLLRGSSVVKKPTDELETSDAASIRESAAHPKRSIPPWIILVAILAIICIGLMVLSEQK